MKNYFVERFCISAILFLVSIFSLIGCASIAHGTKQILKINSEPSGAKVYVKGVQIATTPAQIELKRKQSSTVIRVEKDGYEPIEFILNRVLDYTIIVLQR